MSIIREVSACEDWTGQLSQGGPSRWQCLPEDSSSQTVYFQLLLLIWKMVWCQHWIHMGFQHTDVLHIERKKSTQGWMIFDSDTMLAEFNIHISYDWTCSHLVYLWQPLDMELILRRFSLELGFRTNNCLAVDVVWAGQSQLRLVVAHLLRKHRWKFHHKPWWNLLHNLHMNTSSLICIIIHFEHYSPLAEELPAHQE